MDLLPSSLSRLQAFMSFTNVQILVGAHVDNTMVMSPKKKTENLDRHCPHMTLYNCVFKIKTLFSHLWHRSRGVSYRYCRYLILFFLWVPTKQWSKSLWCTTLSTWARNIECIIIENCTLTLLCATKICNNSQVLCYKNLQISNKTFCNCMFAQIHTESVNLSRNQWVRS